ncbi:hypothetical protein [Puniceicoccus vermicola]|uniref:Diacylglycerol O-acyltransferase n=1 Tax=Puniceicoccus vermicola TaxID=388746 RepID=A0A7X1E3G1_9BACT|nr:hypothetical protein [Puniceicoccus vermicola]MBC2601026.1 hypothetical protein [Puniceicoccus vermicola]
MPRFRKLGFAETFLHHFYTDLGAGLVTVVVARLQKAIPIATLEQAILAVQARHPLLRCRIDPSPNGLQFVECSEFPTPAIADITEEPLTGFETLINSSLPVGPLLWQIGTKRGSTPHLYLKIHHAIADGTAARSLLLEIIRIAEGAPSGDPLPLLPAVESLVAKSKETYDVPLPTPSQNVSWKFAQSKPLPERTCRSILRSTPIGPVQEKSHRQGITVNSLLMESILQNANVTLPGFPSSPSLILPVSVRKRMAPPIADENMGCLIGNALVYAPDSDSIHSPRLGAVLGRQLDHAMTTAITGPEKFNPAMVDSAIDPFRSEEQKEFGFPIALSNLGPASEVPDSVEALWFGASVRPGHLGILVAASTVHENLCLGFHFAEPLVKIEDVENFAEEVVRQLEDQ